MAGGKGFYNPEKSPAQEDELINKLKQIEKAKAKELLFNREYENKLNDLYCNYFSQVGAEYNKPSNFSSLISLSKNLNLRKK